MSTSSDLDLDSLFLPAWAQQPANKNLYAKYEGGEEREGPRRGGRDGDRSGRGGRPGGPRPERSGDSRGPRPQSGGGRGPQDRRGGGTGGSGFGGKGRRDFSPRGERRPESDRPAPVALPEVDAQLRPNDEGVDSLSRQIKVTGRAYPLFGIAKIVLERPERYNVVFTTKKKSDGSVAQPLFVCALDDTVWLSEDEAVAHVLQKHFTTFYQPERTATEPPKGVYTFVAQCGMSGVILGPPNHHDYQNQLRKLHSERFSKMPFDMFKARVKIVRDEEVVKKWVEDQSWKTEYVCLNVPEPLKLPTREEVEKHFRTTHAANIIRSVSSHTVTGVASRALPCRPLYQLARERWHDQDHFPLQLATVLSQQFAQHGLQFFKVNKTVTHVSVARPNFLDLETTVVSDNVKRIMEFITANPKCSRRKMFEALAPAAVATTQPAAEGAPVPELSPEASAIISDLHWLVHQGHVIEFANGTLETAKKPLPKPAKQPAKPVANSPKSTETEPAETTVESVESVVEGLSSEAPLASEAPAETQPTEAAPASESTSETQPASTPA
jgi:hypothetical protein